MNHFLSKPVRKHKCVGFVGLLQAGKTVLLTSLINHFRFHEPQRLPIGSKECSVVELEHLPPCYAAEQFAYDDNRHELSENRWPRKSLVMQEYRALYTRTDWRLGVLDLSLLDIPGERLADMLIARCEKFAGWSDQILSLLRQTPGFSHNCGEYFSHLEELATNTDAADNGDDFALVRAYRVLLAKMVLSATNLVSPSSFLITPSGEYVSKDVLSVSTEKLEETLAERQFCGVSAEEQFAPLSLPLRTKFPVLTATLAAAYDKYRKEVVLPFAQSLARCDELFVLVDIATLLEAGVGMYNATASMLDWLLRYTNPGFNSMAKTFDSILQFGTGGSFELSGIRRLVFVANKADRVHEMDRGNLELLLRSLCQPLIKKFQALRSLKVDFAVCSAVNSTRSEQTGGERYLQFLKGRDVIEPHRRQVPAVPTGWPDSWDASEYEFPRPLPWMPANKMNPPEHIGLHRIAELIVSF